MFRNLYFGYYFESRALVSHIAGNRISDGAKGSAGYAINLQNTGTELIRHNVIQKGPLRDNINCAICIGKEIKCHRRRAGCQTRRTPAMVLLSSRTGF
jgi:hypothetical protein